MKIIISGILITVVVVVAAVVWRSKSVEPESSISGQSAILTLAVLADDVLVKEVGDSDFKKINKEAKVGEGMEIKTSITGRASILYPNGSIASIVESTGLVLKNLGETGTQSKIKLVIGGIRSKIKNVLGIGDYYQIETENMVASVRGTEFSVYFANGISVIEVFENKVEVQAVDPKTGQPIEGGFIELFAGEKTVVDSNNLPSKDNPLKKTKIGSSPTPSIILTNSPLATPRLTFTPTPSPTPVLSPSSTPVPASNSVITSVAPTKLQKPQSGNAEFAINGERLTGVSSVFLNQLQIPFFVVDSFTIFATVGPNIPIGIYDVSVTAANGQKLTLFRALEIQ